MEKVNLNKIDRMSLITFQNSLRLHHDSIVLYQSDSYASAFYLSVIALEELGKIFLLADFLFNSRCNGRFNEYKDDKLVNVLGQDLEENYFKKFIYNHREKQTHFVRIFDALYDPSNNYMKSISEGTIEKKKQNALYVGLKRNKNKIDMSSKIVNPLKTTKNKALQQITLIQKTILDLTINIVIENWSTDSYSLDEYLDEEIYFEIKNWFPIQEKRFQNKLKKLETYIGV